MTRSEFIEHQRRTLFRQQRGKCAHCGRQHYRHSEMELAHRVSNSKVNIRIWGIARVDHQRNKALVCRDRKDGVDCNSSMLIDNRPLEAGELMRSIGDELGIDDEVLW